MATLATVLTAIVGIQHLFFFYLEAVLWTTPFGLKTFRMDAAKAEMTKSLAQNQGLYNGFLAAGCLWAAMAEAPFTLPLREFFLGCVVVAGIGGGITVNFRITILQSTPAALALLLSLMA